MVRVSPISIERHSTGCRGLSHIPLNAFVHPAASTGAQLIPARRIEVIGDTGIPIPVQRDRARPLRLEDVAFDLFIGPPVRATAKLGPIRGIEVIRNARIPVAVERNDIAIAEQLLQNLA